LNGQTTWLATASAMTEWETMRVEKMEMQRVLKDEPQASPGCAGAFPFLKPWERMFGRNQKVGQKAQVHPQRPHGADNRFALFLLSYLFSVFR
jgi:hypothetical protein